MTLEQLTSFIGEVRAPLFLDFLNEHMPKYDITTPVEVQMFMAQAAHESGGFVGMREHLNYSAPELLKLWPKHFNATQAKQCAGNPEKIANRAYANRMGNGDEFSGDGWKYRGAGIFQITGKDMFRLAGARIKNDHTYYVNNPDLVAQPDDAVLTACWFWQMRGLNDLATKGDYTGVTLRINGGLIGQDSRVKWLTKAQEIFK